MFSPGWKPFITNAMYHRNQINTLYMMKQRHWLTTDRKSELNKTSSWATVGPAADKHQAPTHRLKPYARAVIESEAFDFTSTILFTCSAMWERHSSSSCTRAMYGPTQSRITAKLGSWNSRRERGSPTDRKRSPDIFFFILTVGVQW